MTQRQTSALTATISKMKYTARLNRSRMGNIPCESRFAVALGATIVIPRRPEGDR
jgi:hypothetical protein